MTDTEIHRPNLPGRDTVAYRAGTHSSFLAAMLQALGGRPELDGLTTREPDDPAVAVLDAWAGVLDVLAFYQERLANEGFLRTATERGSVLELARAIGYELGPGVAATTWLSFEVVPAPGGLDRFAIPAGTSAQSVPGPGELPQVFETVEEIEARPEWSSIPLLCDAPHRPQPGETVLRLAGTDLTLQPGDPLLVLQPAVAGAGGTAAWFDLRRVRAAAVVPAVAASPTDPEPLVGAHTLVTLDRPLVAGSATPDPTTGLGTTAIFVLRQRAALFGFNAQPWEALPVSLRVGEIDPEILVPGVTRPVRAVPAIAAARSVVLPGAYRSRQASWADATLPAGSTAVDLDQVYPRVVAGSWVAFERPGGTTAVRTLASVTEQPRADFGLAARVSHLTFAAGDLAGFSPRTTNVLGQSEQLQPARRALPDEVADTDTIDLARAVAAPEPGRTVAVTGTDLAGQPVSEVATVKLVTAGPGPGPRLVLRRRLVNRYRRTSVRVLVNVAEATHGESRAEILGSGDQRVPFPSFTLRQRPLTHVSAPTASGTRTTLAVWVAGVRWTEVPSLYGQPPDARVYVVRRTDDGAVTVTFGDGRTGARPPSGQDNLVATYRVGIGRSALLPAGRISIPLARPLGLLNVVNPVPAAGADDPEPLAAARTNAPMTVRTLGRIVSAVDYEDLAAAFAGIGKARADVLWDGERPTVHLTVTGPAGEEIATTSAVHADLLTAIDAVRHATVPVVVGSRHDRRFAVAARLVVDPRRRPEDVLGEARATVVARYSFGSRDLAAPVTAAEVVTTLQQVPGVVAVLLTAFHEHDAPATKEDVIPARPARRAGGTTLPADLVTVEPAMVDLIDAGAGAGGAR